MPVALSGPGLGTFVKAGPDLGRGLGFYQLLADQADSLSDEVNNFAALQRGGQLGQGRLVKGHLVRLVCVLLQEHTEDLADGPT